MSKTKRLSDLEEAFVYKLHKRGISQSEIARMTDLPRTTVQSVIYRLQEQEQPRAVPEIKTVEKITQVAEMGKKTNQVSNGSSDQLELLKRQIEQQSILIQQLLNGEIVAKAGQPPVKQLCEAKVRRCDTSENRRVLLISDLHAPYQHPDALDFLEALHEKYQFDRVINLGDEMDYHAASFHKSEPEALGAKEELVQGREVMRRLHDIFDEMDLVESNHGSMAYRKGKDGGLPRHLITPYRDQIFGEDDGDGGLYRPGGLGDGWRWHPTLTIKIPNNSAPLYLAHGIATDARNAMRRMHCNVAQGHYHTEFHIRYEANPGSGMFFGIAAGCLIDDTQVAFAYNKVTPARPSIGCAGVIEGVPVLFPMIRDPKTNRWNGLVP